MSSGIVDRQAAARLRWRCFAVEWIDDDCGAMQLRKTGHGAFSFGLRRDAAAFARKEKA